MNQRIVQSGNYAEQAEESEVWLQELRKCAIDHMRQQEEREQWTLKEKFFPISCGRNITPMDVVYSESLWATGTLAVSFTAYLLVTFDLAGALAFLLMLVLLMVPLLVLWTLVGAYFLVRYGQKRNL